jgi:hypothetical protein
MVSKAWPYEEARKLLKRYPDGPVDKGIIFRDRLWPQRPSHLGTSQEVARTLMVKHALSENGRLAEPPDRFLRRHGRNGKGRRACRHQEMCTRLWISRSPRCGTLRLRAQGYADHNNNRAALCDDFGFEL